MPINQPPLDKLLKVSKNRYVLAITVARYARHLTDKVNAGLLEEKVKPVSQALEEIAAGKVRFTQPSREQRRPSEPGGQDA
uniref:DNA-directed RNA polymerase subunit omega n=1 Tax=Ammonifex degensii TaxID=42838 RepID=A0A7C2EJ06_9THEO